MGNKYVSLDGNNGNNGLGPDASHASNKPWATLEYAVDNMSDGDVLYVAPGIWRDVITIGVTPTAETIIRGDPMNTSGFKDGSGNLLAAGPVIISNMLTDDVTASTNTTVIDCNSKDFLTFENLWIESMSSSAAVTIGSGSQNITLRKCNIFGLSTSIAITTGVDVAANITIEYCYLFSANATPVNITTTKTNTAPYNCNIVIRNCVIVSIGANYGIQIGTTATATYYGEEIIAQNCTIFASTCFRTGAGYAGSITAKVQCKNCLLIGANGIAQSAGADGDVIVEDYNIIFCSTPRTTVTNAAGHDIAYGSSVFARSIRHEFGQAQLFGFAPKTFMVPWSTSRTIGFGNDSTPTALTTDIWGRVRPSGSGVAAASVLNSVGAHELHDFGVKDTGTKDAGDASLKLTGPGDHEFLVPVAAESTTISIKTRYQSSTYGGTDYPQATLLDLEGFAGITSNTETLTATVAASDAWETLTFTAFTPSRKGVIRLRVRNRGTGADDVCWFDTLAIS